MSRRYGYQRTSKNLLIGFLLIVVSMHSVNSLAQINPKVLVIGIDGCRPDALETASTPNIDALIENGIYSPHALNDDITVSGPGWSAILTGVWSSKHGVTGNSFLGSNYGDYPSIFKRIEQANASLHTASICNWSPINFFIVENAYADYKQNVGSDEEVRTAAVNYLNTNNPDFMFLHFDESDGAGHSYGFSPDVSQYLSEIEQIDSYIADIVTALQNRPNYNNEDWLIMLTTDHGGLGTSHGGSSIQEETVFVIASSDNIPNICVKRDSTLLPPPFNCLNDTAALSFDGVNDYVQIPDNPLFNFNDNQDFTIECRVKTAIAADVAIVGNKDWDTGFNKGFVFSFEYPSGPSWKVNVGDGSSRVDLELGSAIADNEWHTLTASFDRDGMLKMYEDGIFMGETSLASIGDITTNQGIFIGADINNDYNFNGAIAEVRIWDTLVDATTVSNWHCSKLNATHPNYNNLIAYWQLTDNDNTGTVNDASTNNNLGTINGATWQNETENYQYDYANTPRLTDIVPTTLNHLCIDVDIAWNLDGETLINTCANATTPNRMILKTYLQGAYDTTTASMNNQAQLQNLLPIYQPFNEQPWYYSGNEFYTDINDQSLHQITDWILVELRDANDTSLIQSEAALLLSNGNIMGIDGQIGIPITAPINQSYYILVRHRNHLAVLSKTPISAPNLITYDFSTDTTQAAGTEQLTVVASDGSVYGIIAGDIDADGVVSVADFNLYLNEISALNTYTVTDLNFDGAVTIDDFNLYLLNNSAIGINIIRY